MTATASDGTPDPQVGGDGDGGTPADPGGPSEPSGQSGSSGADESFQAIASEMFGVDPGASRRKKTRWAVVLSVRTVLTFVCGTLAAALIGYWLSGLDTPKQNEKQKEYDASQAPFTVFTRPEQGDPGRPWVMVLDRELTAAETRKLTSSRDASVTFSYLKALGGHPLSFPSVMENAPKGYPSTASNSRMEVSDTFKLSVLSTRAAAVSIDDWKVTDVVCRDSTAQTLVALPPQGGTTYQGIRLHLPPRADEPVLTDDAEGQGEPYFDTHYIEVGGGQPSGGLRVEAIAPPGQSCEWGVEVHYVDAYQKEQWLRLKGRDGKPLRLRTESVPLNPRQKWLFGSIPWTPCHLRQLKDPMCGLL
ncbi:MULTISPECIES: hypothetical protein [unclassified Streptomyces]|uniref:hypothetical protein n=1 Tax=unclassified Streptomyces TaxID=2593676 RepID=UPI0007F9FB10|nr:hypothetical protein [Streptomyces sp. SAT1]ANO42011.1 hypothetical protein A8713_032635 [Streptomyces sp. SAT1]